MGAEHPCPLCLRVRHHIPKLPPPPPLSASPLLPWWCWGRPGGLVASGTRANSLAGCRDPVCECALVSPAEWERWGILGDHPRAGVTVAASPPWLKYGGWLLVPVLPGCSASGGRAWEQGWAETRGCGGSMEEGDTPCPTQRSRGRPCARGGREAGVCLGHRDFSPARHLPMTGCAHPPAGSVSLQGSHFLGEDFRGEVACGKKWGLLCWVRGAWRLQHFPCWGLGVGAPSCSTTPHPPELDMEKALLPEIETS